MLPDFIDLKTIYLTLHVFGAILGAGGAFASDAMFFYTIKDGQIDKKELDFMKLGSLLVWTGLIILIISGILLVSTDPEKYFDSAKFLAKMTIVALITLNGIIFHLIHIPHIRGHLEVKFSDSPTFIKKAPFILISGALSMTSWISTVILGMLRQVPYSYLQIMTFYFVIIIIAMTVAFSMKKTILQLK